MSKLYATADTVVRRVTLTDDEDALYGPPPGAAFTLDFDPSTNAAVVASLRDNPAAHTYDGTTLKRQGVTLTVNPDSADYDNFHQLQTAKQNLDAYLALSTPTLAQTAAALKIVIRILYVLVDYLISNGVIKFGPKS